MKFIKSFFKYYLPTLIFFGALGIFVLVYMVTNHKQVLIYALGHGERIHTKTINAIVKENGVELPNAKIFVLEDKNQLYVYNPDSKKILSTIIVDKGKNNIGIPVNYDVFLGNFLFETDESGVVLANGVKWDIEPKLNITEDKITYTTDSFEDKNYVDVNYEIIFKDK